MIGGENYFNQPHTVKDSMSNIFDREIGEVSLFATGRDALFSQLIALPKKRIYLPDLICYSIYVACRDAGKEVLFYKIEDNFLNSIEPIRHRDPDACFFAMHYFGIENNILPAQARACGMLVISDVTHMLFNDKKLQEISGASDYLVASLRKSGPFPDGGFVASQYHSVARASLPIREDFFALRMAGLCSRGFSANNNFVDDENFRLLKRAEEIIDSSPLGSYQCSYFSKELLRTVDVKNSAIKISKNINCLFLLLDGFCKIISNQNFPSPYFVCLFDSRYKRDFVRQQLAHRRVFCPVHWDTSQMPEPSLLSELILSIPCDSRYNEIDMRLIAEIIIS